MADSSYYLPPFCVDFSESFRPEIRVDTMVINIPEKFAVDAGRRLEFVFSEFDTTLIAQRIQKAYSRLYFDKSDCIPKRKINVFISYSFNQEPLVVLNYHRAKGENRPRLIGKYAYSFEEKRWRVFDDSDHNLWYWYTEGYKMRTREKN